MEEGEVRKEGGGEVIGSSSGVNLVGIEEDKDEDKDEEKKEEKDEDCGGDLSTFSFSSTTSTTTSSPSMSMNRSSNVRRWEVGEGRFLLTSFSCFWLWL